MASIFDGFKNRATILSFSDPITGNITEFSIDASLTINTSMSATVTEFPVEGQKTVNDHIQPAPLTISISGVVSESPSQKLLTLATTLATQAVLSSRQYQGLSSAAASGYLASLASSGAARKSGFDKEASFAKLLSNRNEVDPDYPKRAMLGLQKLFDQGIIFNIRTFFSDVLYQNMAATGLSFTQDADTGDSLSFSMTAKKIRTVTAFTEVANEVKIADPANTSATKTENKGKLNKIQKETEPPAALTFRILGALLS